MGAQACYSLGNTYTLLKDYPNAIEYHLRHLRIAQELFDKVGEGRACWSLGNAHSSMGQHLEAYQYAKRHLEISRDTKDRMGQATAQLNLADLCRTLGYTPPDTTDLPHERNSAASNDHSSAASDEAKKSRRVSMEHMDLIKMTPDAKKAAAAAAAASKKKNTDDKENNSSLNKSGLLDEEDFFDFITRFQSKRMDDQRCSLTVPSARDSSNSSNGAVAKPPSINRQPSLVQQQQNQAGPPPPPPPRKPEQPQNNLFDLIGQPQQQRPMGPQILPGLNKAKQPEILQRLSVATSANDQFPDESFFEMLMKCQGSRIEEQRSSLPASELGLQELGLPQPRGGPAENAHGNPPAGAPPLTPPLEAPTVPDEDFFNLIQRLQSGRLEDQRASLQPKK